MTRQTGEPYVSLDIESGSERGEQQPPVVQVSPPDVPVSVAGTGTGTGTGIRNKSKIWFEKVSRFLKNRKTVRRPASPTGPGSFVITVPESGTVSLSTEPSFKSAYKDEVKSIKIAWGAILVGLYLLRSEKGFSTLFYTSVILLLLSFFSWLVTDEVYKQADDEDPKEDWLWKFVATLCKCTCATSFFTTLFVIFLPYEVAVIFTIAFGVICVAYTAIVMFGGKVKDHGHTN
ncbi:uncharacterized protein LOC110914196 [Helianthus annuus]|uniref:uncharacterized protein LOC110914196 n=1 Tax=Helianthus annuus TaxID=4232 RepID=UPI000B908A71|nr:uncharacterized protein LOC110914196 [Helianthus annuus]